jgi:hypothetical protein
MQQDESNRISLSTNKFMSFFFIINFLRLDFEVEIDEISEKQTLSVFTHLGAKRRNLE